MFAQAIKSARKSRGVSQDALAERLNISRPRVVQFEKCDNISEDLFVRCAKALGMTPLELLSFGDERVEAGVGTS